MTLEILFFSWFQKMLNNIKFRTITKTILLQQRKGFQLPPYHLLSKSTKTIKRHSDYKLKGFFFIYQSTSDNDQPQRSFFIGYFIRIIWILINKIKIY